MSVAHYFALWMENGKKIPVPGLEHARKIVMGTAITRKRGHAGFVGSQAPTKS